jgi:hypothetical protein
MVVEKGTAEASARTTINMRTTHDETGLTAVHFVISEAGDRVGRAERWVLRVHLQPRTRVRSAIVDGAVVSSDDETKFG